MPTDLYTGKWALETLGELQRRERVNGVVKVHEVCTGRIEDGVGDVYGGWEINVPGTNQVFAVDILHRQVQIAVDLAKLVNRHDVRVPELRGQQRFAGE